MITLSSRYLSSKRLLNVANSNFSILNKDRNVSYPRFLSSSSSTISPPLVIPIELVSDTLCPNGYIGKKQLHKAIHYMMSRPDPKHDLAFSILRVPFFLEPNYPENVVSVGTNRERLIEKWGGKAGWEAQKKRHNLKGRGQAAGIPHFNLDRLTGNTMASHRLIQHVGKLYGLRISEGLYDRLNIYYFVDGHSLNDKPLLAKLAAEELEKILFAAKDKPNNSKPPPLSENEILSFLHSNEGRDEIEKALHMLQRMHIHGIPKFIIEGSTLIDGAADWKAFVDVFFEIENRGSVQNGGKSIFGEILGIDPDMMTTGSFHTLEDLNANIKTAV